MQQAAIVTLGSELTEGLRVDTNTQRIALALAPLGWRVAEAVSLPDDRRVAAGALERLTARYGLVVATGGLGPTHDDITREAASDALGRPLATDSTILARLGSAAARHADPDAVAQIARMADVLDGAEVVPPVVGTAPGQIVETQAGLLVLLPGPPREMGPMLDLVLARFPRTRALPLDLGTTGLPESDVQVAAHRALATHPDIELTVLAKTGEVRVVLLDDGAGEEGLARAADAVAGELGAACFTRTGETLAQALLREAGERSLDIALAESCTGGMVAEAITDIAGSSAVLLGGVVAYSNAAKTALLGVSPDTLAAHGAVSAATAAEMANGARKALSAQLAVSVTGIAGPHGGSTEKPTGTVWFGVSRRGEATACVLRRFPGDRTSVRMGATAFALDLLRRSVLGLQLPADRP